MNTGVTKNNHYLVISLIRHLKQWHYFFNNILNFYFNKIGYKKKDMKVRTQIAVKTANSGIRVVMLPDILYLKSEGRYTIINLKDNTSLVACKNLGIYEELLKILTLLGYTTVIL